MPARLDIAGQKFGRLTALAYQGWNGAHKTLWSFSCDCGAHIVRRAAGVRRGDVKSCGCLRREGGYIAHNRKPYGESSFQTLYAHYRRAAKDRGYGFTLTKQNFRSLTKLNCSYCGRPPSQIVRAAKGGNGPYIYTGIDRVNNLVGYIQGNVVPCCATCNRAKHVMGRDDFIAWIRLVYHHTKRATNG